MLPSPGEQRLAKREALMQQAALAFRERGFYATSMEDIATALGVTKGALYRYIKSKQEILFECFRSSARIGNAAIELAKEHPGSGLDKLSVFIIDFVSNYLEHNTAGGAMVDVDALFPEQRAEIIAGRDHLDRELRKLMDLGMSDGSIVVSDPKLAEFTLMGSINWIPSWYTPGGTWSPRDVAQAVSETFVRGFKAESADPALVQATRAALGKRPAAAKRGAGKPTKTLR
jgi:TetR/AcrR family transcriptional regulator